MAPSFWGTAGLLCGGLGSSLQPAGRARYLKYALEAGWGSAEAAMAAFETES